MRRWRVLNPSFQSPIANHAFTAWLGAAGPLTCSIWAPCSEIWVAGNAPQASLRRSYYQGKRSIPQPLKLVRHTGSGPKTLAGWLRVSPPRQISRSCSLVIGPARCARRHPSLRIPLGNRHRPLRSVVSRWLQSCLENRYEDQGEAQLTNSP